MFHSHIIFSFMISKRRRLQSGQHELVYSEVKDAHINESTIATPCKECTSNHSQVQGTIRAWNVTQEHKMSQVWKLTNEEVVQYHEIKIFNEATCWTEYWIYMRHYPNCQWIKIDGYNSMCTFLWFYHDFLFWCLMAWKLLQSSKRDNMASKKPLPCIQLYFMYF